jgi:hypothetical protein
MKKTLQRFGIVTVGLSLCLWSCKEQDGILKPSDAGSAVAKEVFVKDGRLVFDSKESFWKQVDALKTPESIVAFNNKFVGFTSMKESYDELLKHDIGNAIKDGSLKKYQYVYQVNTNADGSKEYDIAFMDNKLPSLLSEKALVQIDKTVYMMTDKEMKEVDESNLNELFVPNSPKVKSSSRKMTPLDGSKSASNNKSAKVMGNNPFDCVVKEIPYTPFNGAVQRRFKTYGGISFLSDRVYVTFWVTHKKNNWYGWGNENTNNWLFEVRGIFYGLRYGNAIPGTLPFYTGWTGDNTGDITFGWSEYKNSVVSGYTSNDTFWAIMDGRWIANGVNGVQYNYDSKTDYPLGMKGYVNPY